LVCVFLEVTLAIEVFEAAFQQQATASGFKYLIAELLSVDFDWVFFGVEFCQGGAGACGDHANRRDGSHKDSHFHGSSDLHSWFAYIKTTWSRTSCSTRQGAGRRNTHPIPHAVYELGVDAGPTPNWFGY
jgi:hypothetical protein